MPMNPDTPPNFDECFYFDTISPTEAQALALIQSYFDKLSTKKRKLIAKGLSKNPNAFSLPEAIIFGMATSGFSAVDVRNKLFHLAALGAFPVTGVFDNTGIRDIIPPQAFRRKPN